MATLEENTDVIVGIFKHYGLDPKKHNIFPVEEETEQNAATEAAEENVEEYLQNQIVEEISLEVEFEGPNDEIDDEEFEGPNDEIDDVAFSESVDEAPSWLASSLCHSWRRSVEQTSGPLLCHKCSLRTPP